MEKRGYSKEQVSDSFNGNRQQLILLPTEKCNFRCSYCYEDFKIGKMKPWLVESIKIFISNRVKSINHLALGWFGGEPLLAQKICLDIIEHSYKECKKENVTLSGEFTTNGYYLSDSLVETLSKYNQASFQVTLDGYGEDHNTTRILANERGTFDTIWSNILSLKKSKIDFSMKLRLHITDNNYNSMKRLVLEINKNIGKDKRFSIHFHNISNLGGPNSKKIVVLEKRKYSDVVDELSSLLNIRSNSELSLHKERSICYAAKPNSLLVRADGRIGKCTVAFSNPENDIGVFLENGEIQLDNDKLLPWMYGYDKADENILSCPLKGVFEYNEKNKLKVKVI